MKYIKLLMLLAVVTFFGACSSDDDSWNSAADVTVSMKNPTMVIKENMGLTNVPIEVKGKTNGNVYVTLAVKEVGKKPAKEDVHYYITDKTISISDSIGYVEVEPVDNDEINADRTFEITIVEAKGAKIGNATTQVSLKDNDSQIYEKLQGKWKLTGVSRQGAPMESVVKIIGASDEEDGDYNNTLYMTGMAVSSSSARLSFHYDEDTKQGLKPADIYSGEKGYEALCKRSDIDLVYIAADWNHNFSARHAEGIHTVVLNEVEFPGIVLQIIGVSVLLEISFHGSSQSLSYSYHLSSLRCIGRFLRRSHVLGIFLIRQAQHLCI